MGITVEEYVQKTLKYDVRLWGKLSLDEIKTIK